MLQSRSLKPWIACAVALALPIAAPATAQDREPDREQVMSANFDTHAGGQLRVDVSDADLVLSNGPSDRVEITVWLRAHDMERARARFEKMNFRAEGNDDVVTLTSDRDRDWDWDWRNWGRFGITVEITLPDRYDVDLHTGDGDILAQTLNGEIRIETSDGDIGAERLVGDLRIVTSDGDIVVRHTEGSQVEIRTSDGDISIGELRAERVTLRTSDGDISSASVAASETEARTSDGDIVIDGIRGALKAQTGDGSIHIGIVELGEMSLITGDGDITIEAPESLRADLDLRGEDLDLHSTVAFNGTMTRRQMHGALNGGGPTLSARTNDGTIVLRLRDGD